MCMTFAGNTTSFLLSLSLPFSLSNFFVFFYNDILKVAFPFRLYDRLRISDFSTSHKLGRLEKINDKAKQLLFSEERPGIARTIIHGESLFDLLREIKINNLQIPKSTWIRAM